MPHTKRISSATQKLQKKQKRVRVATDQIVGVVMGKYSNSKKLPAIKYVNLRKGMKQKAMFAALKRMTPSQQRAFLAEVLSTRYD